MDKPNLEVFMIDTIESFGDLREKIDSEKYQFVSLDLETDSADERKAHIYGIGLAFNDSEAFYIPIRKKDASKVWGEFFEEEIYSWISNVCKTHKLIGYNISYDCLVFEYNTHIDISNDIYCDVMMQKHTLEEERPFGLKDCAVLYLGNWADKAKELLLENIKANGGKTLKNEMEMFKADTDVLGDYCGWDVLLTRRLFDLFEPRLDKEGLRKLFYVDEVMPLYKEVTIGMKRHGFTIDLPYFKQLHSEIKRKISSLEHSLMEDLSEDVEEYEKAFLNDNYPCSARGNFPKMYAAANNIPLPLKNDKFSLSKPLIEKCLAEHPEYERFYLWVLEGNFAATDYEIDKTQRYSFFKENPDSRYIFNLRSNDHLGWLFFERLQCKPLSKTEGGQPQCDDKFLESIKSEYSFVSKLIDLKKLTKLCSTYIEGILDRQIDGKIYTSMLQHGTTSGRYSSANPNLQNLPRMKDEESGLSPLVVEYANSIKKGFVAPPGYKILNADYSSLEPICFAHMSGDETLRDVFRNGYDLYSQIAIDVFGVYGCSANKKAKNYLKKLHPELRQKAKVFCLAVVYGAEANRIAQVSDVDYKAADEMIEAYLDAYPNLRKYMNESDMIAKKEGIARTDFGRIRHLPKVRSIYKTYGDKLLSRGYANSNGLNDIRYVYKNYLNNAKNFRIQGLAAHIVNRAAIATTREFKHNNIDAAIIMQVHDELTCIVKESQAIEAKKILKYCMEETTKISVPLSCDPVIGNNWSEAK